MAIDEIAGRSQAGIVVVDGATVRVIRSAAFEAPKAAQYLGKVPDDLRLEAIEDLLEHGAAAANLAQSSAHVVVLESRIAQLTTELGAKLAKQLDDAGEDTNSQTKKLLEEHKLQISKLLSPLTDSSSKDGLPAKMVDLLEVANRNAIKQIEVMLADGDHGVIARAIKQITDQIQETGVALTKEMAARHALLTRSAHRGVAFEEVLSVRLPILARPIGRIEHCARTPGDKAANTGDYVIVLDEGDGDLKIGVEAKSQKTPWSMERVRQELKAVRMNRAASAAILVADKADMLPGKAAFGQVGTFDYFLAYDPEVGDETALMCGLYLAKVAALSTRGNRLGAPVDTGAAQREVSTVRELLEQFSKIEASGSRIEREIDNIRTVAGGLKADIHGALRRLDSILTN
jgi:ribosome recycling factor